MSRTVLFVAPYFPPAGGGLERYVDSIAAGLRRDYGWRTVVAASGRRGLTTVERHDVGGTVVYRLPTALRMSNTPLGPFWRRQLARIVAAEHVDLVNAHAPVPGMADLAARAAGNLPFVLTYHAGPMKKGRWPADLAIWAYENVLMRRLTARADRVVCSSEFVRRSFAGHFFGKSTVIAPGIDTSLFSPAERGQDDHDTVLFVSAALGPSARHKGIDDLLAGVALLRPRYPRLRLDIVGDRSAAAWLLARCRRLGIEDVVTMRGHLTAAELPAVYRRARVVAIPSHNDSLPIVLLEAMACGVPVVTTRVGSMPLVVADGREGYTVDAGDREALAAGIARVFDDRDRAAAMGARARETVTAGYSWDVRTARTHEVFEAAVAARGPRRLRRVAVVAPYYAPRVGGLERYAQRVAEALRDAPDLEPVVVTANHLGRRDEFAEVDGVPVVRLGGAVQLSNTPVNLFWYWRMRVLLRRLRVDLVNAHSPVPYLADVAVAAAGRRPVVLTYHAGSMAKGRPVVDAAIRGYERHVLPRLFGRAAAVVPVSPTSLAHGRPRARQIPPGVDIGLFRPAASPTGDPVLLYAGRLDSTSAWKGVDVLLHAFVRVRTALPAARLVLAGDGDAVDGYREMAGRLGVADAVRFAGLLDDHGLADAYRSASVVVLPSLTDAESFGMCLIEAMACGRPVVGSRVGGVPYVVDDGETGLLVPPGDPDALAAACVGLLRDPQRAARMGAAGRAAVEARYAWPHQTDRYLELFRTLLELPCASA
jgi:glycosyltransferase involved in cell wall biosynthesis